MTNLATQNTTTGNNREESADDSELIFDLKKTIPCRGELFVEKYPKTRELHDGQGCNKQQVKLPAGKTITDFMKSSECLSATRSSGISNQTFCKTCSPWQTPLTRRIPMPTFKSPSTIR